MIYVSSTDNSVISAGVSPTSGGHAITLCVGTELTDNLKWIREFRQRLDIEQRLRAENPMLQELYDSYQTAMALSQP